MATDRQIQQVLAQCVGIMVFYYNCGRSKKSVDGMIAEVQLVAAFLEEMGLDGDEVEASILRPLHGELVRRYGHELGPRLFGEFMGAFEGMREMIRGMEHTSPAPSPQGSPADHRPADEPPSPIDIRMANPR